MKYVIIDTSAGNAEIFCSEYGDYELFDSFEAAASFRELHCDREHSYVFPKESVRKASCGCPFNRVFQRLFFRK